MKPRLKLLPTKPKPQPPAAMPSAGQMNNSYSYSNTFAPQYNLNLSGSYESQGVINDFGLMQLLAG